MSITAQKIDSLLRQEDIEGLIAGGAPENEYNSESAVLFSILLDLEKAERNERNIADIITKIWRESFDLDEAEIESRRGALSRLALAVTKLA